MYLNENRRIKWTTARGTNGNCCSSVEMNSNRTHTQMFDASFPKTCVFHFIIATTPYTLHICIHSIAYVHKKIHVPRKFTLACHVLTLRRYKFQKPKSTLVCCLNGCTFHSLPPSLSLSIVLVLPHKQTSYSGQIFSNACLA